MSQWLAGQAGRYDASASQSSQAPQACLTGVRLGFSCRQTAPPSPMSTA